MEYLAEKKKENKACQVMQFLRKPEITFDRLQSFMCWLDVTACCCLQFRARFALVMHRPDCRLVYDRKYQYRTVLVYMGTSVFLLVVLT